MASAPKPGWDVFLSHNSADRARVRRLAKALETRGVRVWFDEVAIPAGSSIPLAVEEGVDGSRVMILCLSPNFLASEWTSAERSAMQFADPANRNRSLLPVRFGRCALPKNLAHLKYIDYLRHSDKAVDDIVAALNLGSPGPPPPKHPIAVMLDEVKELDSTGDDRAALQRAREARDLAESAVGDAAPNGPLLARARKAYAQELLFRHGDLDEIWQVACAAVATPGIEEDPDVQFGALITKAEAATATGRIRLADGALRAASDLMVEMPDPKAARRMLLQVRAQVEARRGRPKEGIALYDEAAGEFMSLLAVEADAARVRKVKRGVATCLNNKALLLRDIGDTDAALRALVEANRWYAEADSPVDEAVSRLLLARGSFATGDERGGWEALDRATALSRAAGFDDGLIECLELRGSAHATTGAIDEAIAAFDEGVAVATAAGDDRGVMSFHWKLATLARDFRPDKESALRHLSLAHNSALAVGDMQAASEIALERDALSDGGGNAESLRSGLIASLQQELQDTEVPARAAYLLARLGSEQRMAGELEAARTVFVRARRAFEELGDVVNVGKVLLSTAEVEMALGMYAEPTRLLNEALTIIAGRGNWEVEVGARVCLARLVLADGDPRTARQLLDDATVIANSQRMHSEMETIESMGRDVDRFLDLHAVPELSLTELGTELSKLVSLPYTDDGPLLRLWFYWRGPVLLANLRADPKAAALIVSSDAGAISAARDDFAVLFETGAFGSTEPFADGPMAVDSVWFPADWPIPECVGFRPAVMIPLGGDDQPTEAPDE